MNAKKLSAMALAAVMLTFPLSSCGTGNPASTTEAPGETTGVPVTSEGETTTEAELKPNIPDKKFDGYEINFLVRGPADTVWQSRDIIADEETGDALNDAVYARNKYVEDLLDVKIKGTYDDTSTNSAAAVRKMIQADACPYDVIMPKTTELGAMITNGSLTNLRNVPYLDLTQPWWDKGVTRDWSLENKVYVACGDITFTPNNAQRILMFNKKMIRDFALEDPYTLVRTNKWTLDKFSEMIKGVSLDENGDGKMDEKDRWGYLVQNGITSNMYYATGENVTTKDANDLPTISVGNDRSMNVLNKINALLTQPNAVMFDSDYTHIDASAEHVLQAVFEANRGLFFAEVMQLVERMRATEVEFGILPMPKYDENQKDYYTFADSWCMTGVTIPVTNTELERTGIIVEAMAAKAKYTVTPAYYKQSLEGKYFRDYESKEMLDIIIQNRIVSLDEMFGWGMQTTIQDALKKRDPQGNFVSAIEKKQAAVQSKIQKTIDTLAELG